MNKINLLSDSKFFKRDGSKTASEAELIASLDSKFDKDKLGAMKHIVAMMTLGQDVSAFFPAVIKNVNVEATEVKKLIYMFIVRYASDDPELALMCINSLQKDMDGRNQLTRANALKAMSSIRVSVVVPLVVIALNKAIKDSSAFVRKAAAHAIPKVFAIDSSQKDQLVEMIGRLLADKECMVLSGALYAFSQVCPGKFDLLHTHFRKLCHLLADMDEWGQAVCLDVLMRYARTQFVSPFGQGNMSGAGKINDNDDKNTDSDDHDNFYSDEEGDRDADKADKEEPAGYRMDPDHRLLLNASKTLSISQNTTVIMSLMSLFFHLAPTSECDFCVAALCHKLKNFKEHNFVLLSNVATIVAQRPRLFRHHLNVFFVNVTDPFSVRELKLEIMSHLADESNCAIILRELQDYVRDPDTRFVQATIKAIGRCAMISKDVAGKCMAGLQSLVRSCQTEAVVAECVVTIRQLLQNAPNDHDRQVRALTKIVHEVTEPQARASIVWIIGEYHHKVAKFAPDALRQLAKGFREEADVVKVQIVNLAVKLFLSPDTQQQTALLFKYILDLCKYDMNFDIRDRARLIRGAFHNKKKKKDAAEPEAELSPEAQAAQEALRTQLQQMFLTEKPTPTITSPFADRERFTLGSLSHVVLHAATGYLALEDFPLVAPNASVRRPKAVEVAMSSSSRGSSRHKSGKGSSSQSKKKKKSQEDHRYDSLDEFYSSSDGHASDLEEFSESASDGYDTDSDSGYSSASGSEHSGYSSYGGSYSSSASESESESESDSQAQSTPAKKANNDNFSSGADDDDDDFEFAVSAAVRKSPPASSSQPATESSPTQTAANTTKSEAPSQSTGDVFADFMGTVDTQESGHVDDILSSLSAVTVSTPQTPVSQSSPVSTPTSVFGVKAPKRGASGSLLEWTAGGGLEMSFSFARSKSIYGAQLNAVHVSLTNRNESDVLEDIRCVDSESMSGQSVRVFEPVAALEPGSQHDAKLHVNFGGSSSGVRFRIKHNRGEFVVTLPYPQSEMVRPHLLSADDFAQQQQSLSGMSEQTASVSLASPDSCVQQLVDAINLAAHQPIQQDGAEVLRFSGQLLKDDSLVLVEIVRQSDEAKAKVKVNSADFMFGGHVLSIVKSALE